MAKEADDKVVVKVTLVMDLEGNVESYSATMQMPGLAKVKVGPVEDIDDLWPLLMSAAGQQIMTAVLRTNLSEALGGNVSFE